MDHVGLAHQAGVVPAWIVLGGSAGLQQQHPGSGGQVEGCGEFRVLEGGGWLCGLGCVWWEEGLHCEG